MDNAISRSAVTEIIKLHNQLGALVRKSVQLVWELGQKLQAAKNTLDHGDFIPWLEKNLGTLISRTTAFRYMSVFNRYPNGLPEDITLTQAYVDAGVKKLAAPEHEEEDPRPLPTRRDYEIKAIENLPVISDELELKNYRCTVSSDGIVLSYHRLAPGRPLPVAQLYPSYIQGTEEARMKYIRLIQQATEHYLADMEELEERGVINPPVDKSPRAVMSRLVEKEKKPSKAKAAPAKPGKRPRRPAGTGGMMK